MDLRLNFLIALLFFFPALANALTTVSNQPQVVVSDQPFATQVGIDILNQGGNAIDAAVAVGYALAVTFPCCGNIGGGGFMLIHLANGTNTVINFREKAPQAISPHLFYAQGKQTGSSTLGFLAVGIPGTVLGLNTALKQYGTMPLTTVMTPAIKLANEGFILNKPEAKILNSATSYFKTQPNVAAIFLKNGKPLQPADKLVQSQLGKTLELIAQNGADVFYHGQIADEIVAASEKNHGVISREDFANYIIKQQQPIYCHYRGYQIITIPPPGSGATVCEILNISDGYPLRKFGYHTAESVHYIVEAMRYAYADRNTYLADPDFVSIPTENLISPEYATRIRKKISPFVAGDSSKLGFISKSTEKQQTTAYAIADKYGNVVVITYTLNGPFGAKVIAGNTGFFLNNELDDFTIRPGMPNMFGLIQGNANLIAPNKRPLSSIAPVIIMKDKQFVAALATPGGSTIPTQIVEAIENLVDYQMPITNAISALRFHMQWLPDIVYKEPFVFSLINNIKLKQMGYDFQLGSPYGFLFWGSMVGITKGLKNDLLEGAAQ